MKHIAPALEFTFDTPEPMKLVMETGTDFDRVAREQAQKEAAQLQTEWITDENN